MANLGGGTPVDGEEVVGAYTIIDDGEQTITFDGSGSADPDADFGDEITSYTWTIAAASAQRKRRSTTTVRLTKQRSGAASPS